MIQKLEELLNMEIDTSSMKEVFEYLTIKYGNVKLEGGIAASSGCVSCNDGGGCTSGGKAANNYRTKYEK